MQKILKSVAIACLLIATQSVNAQNEAKTISIDQKKNVFKVNLTSLIFKNLSFQYERVVAKKTSVALGLSVMPKTGLPFASTVKDKWGGNADAARAIDQTQLSNFSITPEVRFYLGKKQAPTGFYIAPFGRYNQLRFDQIYTFTPSDNTLHTANVKGTLNNIGGGILIGSQWNLSKSMTLDWWIAGPIYGSSNGKLSGTDPKGIPAQDRAKVKSDIESTNIPGTKMEATVGANQIDVNLSGPYVGLRAFGIALGIKF
ncbi:DUF3575 domain-containing protein [Segetibacter koreensis]|uniref:DUF3575 domain-containing protein n=1 Tax=Segetibacter koreensis TaxID=398037 RepID=UPI00036F9C30|nr:DUF3575 domain-containing protein [Segetibacter koreensis]